MEELLNQLSPEKREKLNHYLRPEIADHADKLLGEIVKVSNEFNLDIIDVYRVLAYAAMRVVNSVYFAELSKEEIEKTTQDTSSLANDLLGKLFTDVLGIESKIKTEQMLLLPLFMMDNLAFNLFTQTLMEEEK